MKSRFTKTLSMPLIAAFAFAAFPALAADMYSGGLKGAPAYVAPSVWSGFYLGVNGGYGWGANSSTLDTYAFHDWDNYDGAGVATLTTEGGFGGGQIGFNVQRDRLVFGIEADIQGADIGGSKDSFAINSGIHPDVETYALVKSRLDWFGTLRGRLGYSFGSSMVYATGGLAYGSIKDTLTGTVTADLYPTGSSQVLLADSHTSNATGYAVGGGFETMLTPSWSVKAEYQYIDLGSTTLYDINGVTQHTYEHTYTDVGDASVKVDHTYHTARVGLNYKFNPVYEPLK
jgi:outer membrane immunogenic protein